MKYIFILIIYFFPVLLHAQDSCICNIDRSNFDLIECDLEYNNAHNYNKVIYSILEYEDRDSSLMYVKAEATYIYTIIPCFNRKYKPEKGMKYSYLFQTFLDGGVHLLNTRDNAKLILENGIETRVESGISFYYHTGRESPLFVINTSDSLSTFRYKSFQGSWMVDLIEKYYLFNNERFPVYRYSISDYVFKGRKKLLNLRLELDFIPKIGIYRYQGFNRKGKLLVNLELKRINSCPIEEFIKVCPPITPFKSY
ncbi:MAG: hypothetical protein KF690_00665 [Bacteroidetes bacterium]|nr:hypothetical protein [Bacteroidota bacterium]